MKTTLVALAGLVLALPGAPVPGADRFSIGEARACPGQRVSVPVRAFLEAPAEAYSLSLRYDPQALTPSADPVDFTGAAGGVALDFATAWAFPDRPALVVGVVVELNIDPTRPPRLVPAGDVLLCTLQFELWSGAPPGVAPLLFEDRPDDVPPALNRLTRGGRSIGQEDGLVLVDGQVTVVDPASPECRVLCLSAAGVRTCDEARPGGPGLPGPSRVAEIVAGKARPASGSPAGLPATMSALLSGGARAGTVTLAAALGAPGGGGVRFLRGDSNGDGRLNISDPLFLAGTVARGLDAGLACPRASDVNDDERLDFTDVTGELERLFRALPEGKLAAVGCERDDGAGGLGCPESPWCD